jgi:hypothetical protein
LAEIPAISKTFGNNHIRRGRSVRKFTIIRSYMKPIVPSALSGESFGHYALAVKCRGDRNAELVRKTDQGLLRMVPRRAVPGKDDGSFRGRQNSSGPALSVTAKAHPQEPDLPEAAQPRRSPA